MKNLKKRILSLITAAAVAFGSIGALPETVLLPDLSVTASAETEFTEAATWTELKDALTAGGDVRLTGNVTAGNSDTALVVPSGKTVTLDLNGHTIDRGLKGKDAVSDNVITVRGNLTLTDSSTGEPGTITGGKTNGNGGGVYVNGTFTMSGGTISDCSATWGGGVYVNGGEFTMQGGTISGCSANYGGGVYVNGGEFTMSGDTISGCSAGFGGGVYVKNGATFTMSGGTISGCPSNGYGGGVYVNDTFTMSGGTISCCGAGRGGGMYVDTDGTFNVSGAPVISGNTEDNKANNVVFQSSHPTKTINVIGELTTGTTGASIYVNAGKDEAVAVGSDYTLKAEDAECFHSDSDGLASVLVTDIVNITLHIFSKIASSDENPHSHVA
ncbi:MAG: hypothetical protein J6N15_08890 [Ruminiclostridium sp.]|nr:hypothetical protein [Ruminiclostridium sp.]